MTYPKVYPRRLAPVEVKELVEKGISTYEIERTVSGWRFSWFPDGTHDCDKEGKHYLYKALNERLGNLDAEIAEINEQSKVLASRGRSYLPQIEKDLALVKELLATYERTKKK